jgi:hypothetical protein
MVHAHAADTRTNTSPIADVETNMIFFFTDRLLILFSPFACPSTSVPAALLALVAPPLRPFVIGGRVPASLRFVLRVTRTVAHAHADVSR